MSPGIDLSSLSIQGAPSSSSETGLMGRHNGHEEKGKRELYNGDISSTYMNGHTCPPHPAHHFTVCIFYRMKFLHIIDYNQNILIYLTDMLSNMDRLIQVRLRLWIIMVGTGTMSRAQSLMATIDCSIHTEVQFSIQVASKGWHLHQLRSNPIGHNRFVHLL